MLFWEIVLCALEIQGFLFWLLSIARQVVSELPRFRLGFFLEIRRTSGSDSVEIVCRSQKDARSAQGIFGGIDPVRNSI